MKDVLSNVVDKIDLQIIELLIQNHDNKKISSILKIPVSTVQRRVRKIIEKGTVSSNTRINYETLGFKTGLIHIYLNNVILKKYQPLIA
jgi:DNA-binding Lrp family transcriptional regulator